MGIKHRNRSKEQDGPEMLTQGLENKTFFITCSYLFYVEGMHATVLRWRSEVNSWELALSTWVLGTQFR